MRDLTRVIWLGRVAGLDVVGEGADGELSLGASLTLADAAPLLVEGQDASFQNKTHLAIEAAGFGGNTGV